MCGIYSTNIPYKEQEVKEKLKSINFRGPDNQGIKSIDQIILGHLRLSILDLDPRSDQPFSFDKLHIVFNGEIYNHNELRAELQILGYTFETKSDTEVLLVGYKEWGKDILPKLNGMFAFCIYDEETKILFCARDRLGVKPFYYYWKDGQFEICSQLKPINSDRTISPEAVSIYLDCTYIPSPFSVYRDIYKLPPGSFMDINLATRKKTITEYWNLNKVEIRNVTYEAAKDELHELLKDAVRVRLQADVPIGSFLSGGIDSALVSSIASSLSSSPINTLSIGFDNKMYDESVVASKYAEIIGSNHNTIICTPDDVIKLIPKLLDAYDEPFADSSALPSLLLNSKTKQHVTVALSGDGGDESFLGYYHFEWVKKFTKLLKIPYIFRKVAAQVFHFNLFGHRTEIFKNILETRNTNEFIRNIFLGFNSIVKNRDLTWFSNYSHSLNLADHPMQKAADLNIKLWLENDSNVKTDRASMAYSVEIRSPFLDYRIIEFARKLPISFRYKSGVRKRMLRDILENYIPKELFDQPKKGFSIPLDEWIRKDLKHEFVETLSDKNLNVVPNLNVKKFKKMFHLHLNTNQNYSSYIWRVYIFIKWYQNTHLKN